MLLVTKFVSNVIKPKLKQNETSNILPHQLIFGLIPSKLALAQQNIGAPVAQWVKRWPTDLVDRVRSSLEVKSSQP